ncbi:MAG TPA: hypothetical protein VFG77_01180 [Nitrososphaeraceae archaeon]|nr:hypothetical protein [Nitrososphaeraceae archaeon]
MRPQETQPGLVGIEVYGIPVESRTLPAACMDNLPMQIRPWKILYKKTYKHYESSVLIDQTQLISKKLSVSKTSLRVCTQLAD